MKSGKPAAMLALIVAAVSLAGCSGGETDDATGGTGRPPPASGKGAISGLLIDDVYRPIPGGVIFLEGMGLTATTDARGQFEFLDLEPGSYIAIVTADRHEGAPQNIDVVAGEYAEVEIQARRLFSEGGRTVTTEYSVFISCAIDFVANGIVYDCTGDASGDSDRASFVVDYTDHGDNVTYLVSEMLANKVDRYEVQMRSTGCSGGGYYAVSQFEGDYVRQILVLDNVSSESAELSYGPNSPWENDCKLQTILFSDSQGREELQGAGAPVCCGAGAHFGIKAKFLHTLFLGPPEVDVQHYCVLATTC